MKSLYESILGNNGAGLEKELRNWLARYCNIEWTAKHYGETIIRTTPDGFDIQFPYTNSWIEFIIAKQMLVNGELPYKIHGIYDSNGDPLTITVSDCTLKSFKNFPVTSSEITFVGAQLGDLSQLPKNYKSVTFLTKKTPTHKTPCKFEKATGLNIQHWVCNGCSVQYPIENFKNNTILDFCLGGLTVPSNSNYIIGKDAEQLETILNNNNIQLDDITYFPYFWGEIPKRDRGYIKKRPKKYGGYQYVTAPQLHSGMRQEKL